MRLKKIVAAAAAVALSVGMLTGCGSSQNGAAPKTEADGAALSVVCTTFPAYDWARQVVGERADKVSITYLMGNGTDLHSYQPTVEDMAKIADSDLFVYVGGESDTWTTDAMAASSREGQRSLSLLKAVGDAAVEEEDVEGMQAEEHDHEHEEGEAADHEHEEAEEHEHEGEAEYDEHVWLSLRNAQVLVHALASELSALDPEGAATYEANAEAYCAQLAELDGRYQQAVAAGKHDTLVFADRFPFRYLVDDYGLKYSAAFVGCSAETEASFETVAYLAERVKELDLTSVLVIENSDQKIAKTVLETAGGTDRKILVMDSLQSTTTDDIATGKSYLTTMESNLDVLVEALG